MENTRSGCFRKSPVTPEARPHSVSTASKTVADRRGASCAVANNVVETLCNRIERHAAAFVLHMLKTNAAAWHLHSVLDSACGDVVTMLWGFLGRSGRVVGAPLAHC